jgi:hypothetical protein
MQTSPPTESDAARTHVDARHRHLQRILENYGVLTRRTLYELAGAEHWPPSFDTVLRRAICSGRVRPPGTDLLESNRPRSTDRSTSR